MNRTTTASRSDAYEVIRRGMDPQHAVVGAVAGLIVAIAVSVGLKQIANRVVRLNRSALEISRGDLSKSLPSERPFLFGADEVDELTVAISHMQENRAAGVLDVAHQVAQWPTPPTRCRSPPAT